MKLTMCTYRDEDDYWRIREFLRQVFLLNGRRGLSWQVARLDYWRWHGIENCKAYPSIDGVTFIWETADGRIAAVLNPEGKGEAFLQVHPGLRTPELEEEMLVVAEKHLAIPSSTGQRKLRVWANEQDDLRQDILIRRGYTKGDWPEYQRQRSSDMPIPEAQPAPGYTVRALGDVEELPARSWVSWKAFHPNEPDENYEGWEWYHNIQRIPLYRRDLDIVAVAPNGEFASFCTVWYDDVTRTGYFEPVGTAPAHQQRGLGKAVMCEALRRLTRMGATMATVAGFTPAANALYASVVSTEYDLFEPWEQEL
jgi:mycothiol synthase